jgi:beta-glucosidase-like glycosyl hydrolase
MIYALTNCFVISAADAGHTRHNFDAKVPLDALADYYLPAFKGCVMEGKVKGIMCSYNAVNVSRHSNPCLLSCSLSTLTDRLI